MSKRNRREEKLKISDELEVSLSSSKEMTINGIVTENDIEAGDYCYVEIKGMGKKQPFEVINKKYPSGKTKMEETGYWARYWGRKGKMSELDFSDIEISKITDKKEISNIRQASSLC